MAFRKLLQYKIVDRTPSVRMHAGCRKSPNATPPLFSLIFSFASMLSDSIAVVESTIDGGTLLDGNDVDIILGVLLDVVVGVVLGVVVGMMLGVVLGVVLGDEDGIADDFDVGLSEGTVE